MGKAQDFLTEKQARGGAVAIEEVQEELARGDWGRIATQTVDELTSYWFNDGSRLVSGRFNEEEFIIRADPAHSEEDLQKMTPDEVEHQRAMIDSLKESNNHPPKSSQRTPSRLREEHGSKLRPLKKD